MEKLISVTAVRGAWRLDMLRHFTILMTAIFSIAIADTANARHWHGHHQRGTIHHPHVLDANGNGVIVGGRPAGCPHNFCGCEASRYLFGVMHAELNLASNWVRKFPRTSASPGKAAVRNHHVMVLISPVGGSNWLVHDGNSGNGLTRDHVRSIRGYTIVDPQGSRLARVR